MLHGLINDFCEDSQKNVNWCITIPTDRNIKHGMKKLLDAGIKKQKLGLLERAAMVPLMPVAEHMAVDALKKVRILSLYELIVDQQEHLTDAQKEQMKKAYEEKL